MDSGNKQEPTGFSKWMKELIPTEEIQGEGAEKMQKDSYVNNRPIEPEGKKSNRPRISKWIVFLLVIGLILLSHYRAPILTYIGNYLIVKQPLENADLIVCMASEPVARGLAAAEFYKNGLAPRVFIMRKELPDGYEDLKERKIHYPETRDLLIMMLEGLGVPRSACLTSDHFVGSTFEEGKMVRDYVREQGYRSLIIVTSPYHTRRTWLTFKKLFEKDGVKVIMMPSHYSGFRADDWWKTNKYIKELIIEYQKLIYYTLKYFL